MTIIRTMRCNGCNEDITDQDHRAYIEMKEPDGWRGARDLIRPKHFHDLECAHKYTTARVEQRRKAAAERAVQIAEHDRTRKKP